ncbi:calcium-binding EGF domain containing protein [Nitzschia inconspicua]|uniref:Calcium-binding EGF domain containing protein n=1 Tax=Nitzschia inconspicua TaxID=303405 RepID=A0A9K3LI82_9STRA|nr:calcium-binding EGF domain containing protein [Nitzschia inconspicua]
MTTIRCLKFLLMGTLGLGVAVQAETTTSCERLKATLTYTQEQAPRDLSSVLPVVVEKVNRVLDGVVDVEVEWKGADLHGRVGEHIVECTVTRLASTVTDEKKKTETTVDEYGREVTSQCFHVPFTILDTNECTLPLNHPMRHHCSAPSVCVNTQGSYECLCPRLGENSSSSSVPTTADESFWKELDAETNRSPWELSFSSPSKTSCPSAASTYGCCPAKYTADGIKCRANFRCPVDPCKDKDAYDCAPNAQCVRAESPVHVPNHSCQCPDGLMGNGKACGPADPKPEPKVMFDGVSPTELTVKNNYYCGCTKPKIDACSGFPPCKGKHEICTVSATNKPMCACKPGYVHHQEYGCVDVNAPTLKLRHDPQGDRTLRLRQGDEYREYMVDIVDDNAEDYLRSLKVTYSRPLPPGCLTNIGEFHVNYTVAMPWANPTYVRVTRRVVIEDIDECSLDVAKYQRTCPAIVPQCDISAGAQCRNTIGSYTCQCPRNTSGDGFLKTARFFDDYPAPPSFKGGSSCVDTTKPIISLQGPNPKIFKICACGGLDGVMTSTSGQDDMQLQSDQRKLYEADIREMIRETAGAELCATHDQPRPSPADCIKAVDHTHRGDVDLSNQVVVGDPVQKSRLHWVVPYNVKDEAGNEATTVYRDVIVEEVDLKTVEKKIREEVRKEQQQITQRAIDAAVREERRKWEQENRATQRGRRNTGSAANTCPACPPCDCPDMAPADAKRCAAFCDNVSASCKLSDDNFIYGILLWFGEFFSPHLVMVIALSICVYFVILLARFVVFVLNPGASSSYDYKGNNTIDDSDLFLSPSQRQQQQHAASQQQILQPASRSTPMNGVGSGGIFSPQQQQPQQQPSFGSPPPNASLFASNGVESAGYDNGGRSFRSPGLITPSKNGEGARHGRIPYR